MTDIKKDVIHLQNGISKQYSHYHSKHKTVFIQITERLLLIHVIDNSC